MNVVTRQQMIGQPASLVHNVRVGVVVQQSFDYVQRLLYSVAVPKAVRVHRCKTTTRVKI